MLPGNDNSQAGLEKRLQDQKELTLEYFRILARADRELDELREQNLLKAGPAENEPNTSRRNPAFKYHLALVRAEAENRKLREHVHELRSVLKQLRVSFKALSASRRWKVGDALGRAAAFVSRKRGYVDPVRRMRELFEQIDGLQRKILRKKPGITRPASAGSARDGGVLVEQMDRLHRDFQTVIHSYGWRAGDFIVSGFSRVFGHSRELDSVRRIKRIFDDYLNWKKDRPSEPLSSRDIRILDHWIGALKPDFKAFRESRRWRLGNALTRPFRIMGRARAGGNAMERTEKLFKRL